MTLEEARQLVLSPQADGKQLKAVLDQYPEFRVTIAAHPNADTDVLRAAVALNDPAVDAVLAWRQPPPGGWGRPLRPEANSSAGETIESMRRDDLSPVHPKHQHPQDSIGDDAAPPSGFVDSSLGDKRPGKSRSKQGFIWVGIIVVIAAVVTGGLLRGLPSASSVAADATLREYPSLPVSQWTLEADRVIEAAQQINADISADSAQITWTAEGDRALVEVADYGDLLTVDLPDGQANGVPQRVYMGVDLGNGTIDWTIDSEAVYTGGVSCSLRGADIVSCGYSAAEDRRREVLFDAATGVSLSIPDGWWVAQAGLIVSAGPSLTDGSVRFEATQHGEMLWQTDVILPEAFITSLMLDPNAHVGWTAPLAQSELNDRSDAVVLMLFGSAPCVPLQNTIRENNVEDQTCMDAAAGIRHVALDHTDGTELLVSTAFPLARSGGDWIVGISADSESDDADSSVAQGIQVINTADGSQHVLPVAPSEFMEYSTRVATADDIFVLVNGGEIVAFERGAWDAPLWESQVRAGEQAEASVTILDDTVVVGVSAVSDSEENTAEVTVLDLYSGQQLWKRPGSILGVDGSRVMVTSDRDSGVIAFSPRDNKDEWTYEAIGRVSRAGSWLMSCDWERNCGVLTSDGQ